jgi:hypothetical protein
LKELIKAVSFKVVGSPPQSSSSAMNESGKVRSDNGVSLSGLQLDVCRRKYFVSEQCDLPAVRFIDLIACGLHLRFVSVMRNAVRFKGPGTFHCCRQYAGQMKDLTNLPVKLVQIGSVQLCCT